ncbi:MAG: SDR family NAD(P)-dependent oxidoreductase [Actinomycetota bacterium]|nr:SDR family NAD(P)-dependent oxidoreductase [Actinomycetota bacterium]
MDVAFNNAGVEQLSTPAAELTESEWDRVLDTNLRGVFLSMKHQIPLMLEQGGGAIVNTSSGAGVKGFPGGAAHGASKFGVIGLTKTVVTGAWASVAPSPYIGLSQGTIRPHPARRPPAPDGATSCDLEASGRMRAVGWHACVRGQEVLPGPRPTARFGLAQATVPHVRVAPSHAAAPGAIPRSVRRTSSCPCSFRVTRTGVLISSKVGTDDGFVTKPTTHGAC